MRSFSTSTCGILEAFNKASDSTCGGFCDLAGIPCLESLGEVAEVDWGDNFLPEPGRLDVNVGMPDPVPRGG